MQKLFNTVLVATVYLLGTTTRKSRGSVASLGGGTLTVWTGLSMLNGIDAASTTINLGVGVPVNVLLDLTQLTGTSNIASVVIKYSQNFSQNGLKLIPHFVRNYTQGEIREAHQILTDNVDKVTEKFSNGVQVNQEASLTSFLYSEGKLKWRYQTSNFIDSSPAIGGDGTIYVRSVDSYLYAIYPGGTLKWRYQTGAYVANTYSSPSPAIGVDGTIYVGSYDSYLYAIYPGGGLKWKYQTGGRLYAPACVGVDGTIYVGSNDGNLYALYPEGILKWRYQTGSREFYSSPSIGGDGTIYVGGSTSRNLYALYPGGTLKWQYQTGGSVHSSPAIGGDGTIYVGSYDSYLYAIYPGGTLKWRYKTGGSWVYSSPAIGGDGMIYVGSLDSYIYAIYPGGTLKWQYKTANTVYSSPSIGWDGTIYVGSNDGNLYALYPGGTLNWKYQTSNYIAYSSPAIGGDGTIYVGSRDNYFYAISSKTFTSIPSWPQFHQNNLHAGVQLAQQQLQLFDMRYLKFEGTTRLNGLFKLEVVADQMQPLYIWVKAGISSPTTTTTLTSTKTSSQTFTQTSTESRTTSPTFTNTNSITNTLTQTFTNANSITNTLTQTFTKSGTESRTVRPIRISAMVRSNNYYSNCSIKNPIFDQIIDINSIYNYKIQADEVFNGNIAYMYATETGSTILPYWLSNLNTQLISINGEVYGFTVQERIVYLVYLGDKGLVLKMFNITVPNNTDAPNNNDYYSNSGGITLQGDLAYIVAGEYGLQIFNITDPKNSDIIDYDRLEILRSNGLEIQGNLGYVAAGDSGLQIINITDPFNLITISYIPTKYYAKSLALKGSLAYVVDIEGLNIINITDPNNATILCNVPVSGYNAIQVVLQESLAYVLDIKGLNIINTTDPNNAYIISYVPVIGNAIEVVLQGSKAYIRNNYGDLQIINITDPNSSYSIVYPTTGIVRKIAAQGDLVYVLLANSDYYNSLQIINLREVLLYGPITGAYMKYKDTSDLTITATDYLGNTCTNNFKITLDQLPILNNQIENSQYFSQQAISIAFTVNNLFTGRGYLKPSIENKPQWLNLLITPKLIFTYRYADSSINDIVSSENYAYLASDKGLLIIDSSNPYSIFLSNNYPTFDISTKIKIKDDTVFLATSTQLLTINTTLSPAKLIKNYNYPDITDISYIYNKLLISDGKRLLIVPLYSTLSYLSNGRCSGVAVEGQVAYVAASSKGLQMINITDPNNAYTINYISNGDYANGVAVKKSMAYVAAGLSGLQIINITDPNNVTMLHNVPVSGYNAIQVVLQESLAYVLDTRGLNIINITDPNNAYALSYLPIIFRIVNEFLVEEGLAYILTYSDLQIINVTDPDNATILNCLPTDSANGIVLQGSLAYVVAGDRGLQIINITDPNNAYTINYVSTSGFAKAVAVQGSLAYVAVVAVDDGGSGLQIINITDPNNAYTISYTQTSTYANKVALQGSLAYVAVSDLLSNIDVIEVTNPYKPYILRYESSTFTEDHTVVDGLALEGSLAFVATHSGLQIIGIPVLINISSNHIAKFNDTIFLLATKEDIKIIQLQDINTNVISTYPMPFVKKIEIIDGLVFIINSFEMQVVNFNNLIENNTLIYLGRYKASSTLNSIAISSISNQAFMATNNGLEIVDITIISNPLLIGFYKTQTPVLAVSVIGTTVFLAAGKSGLLILDCGSTWNLIGTPTVFDIGNYNLTLTVTDVLGAQASGNFSILVMGAPVLIKNVSNQIAYVDKLLDFSLPTNTFNDINKNVLTYSATSDTSFLPAWLTFDSYNIRFYGTPSLNDAYFYVDKILSINLTAMNQGPIGASVIFNISVRGIERPPQVINNIPNQIATVNKNFNFIISNIFSDSFPLRYTAILAQSEKSLPDWLTFDPASLRFYGVPGMGDTNFFQDHILNINVSAVNAGPIATSTLFNINVTGMSYGEMGIIILGSILAGTIGAFHLYRQVDFIKHLYNTRIKFKPWLAYGYKDIKTINTGYNEVLMCSRKPLLNEIKSNIIYLYLEKNNLLHENLALKENEEEGYDDHLREYDLKYICKKRDVITSYEKVITCTVKPESNQMSPKTVYLYLENNQLKYTFKKYLYKKALNSNSDNLEDKILNYARREDTSTVNSDLDVFNKIKGILNKQTEEQKQLHATIKMNFFELVANGGVAPFDIVTINDKQIYLSLKPMLKDIYSLDPNTLTLKHLPAEYKSSLFDFSANKGHKKRVKQLEEYKIFPAGTKDLQKVIEIYKRNPMIGYSVKTVDVIYNPSMQRAFFDNLQMLQGRNNNIAFKPKFEREKELDTDGNIKREMNIDGTVGSAILEKDENKKLRAQIIEMWVKMAEPYQDPDFPNVKLLPVWHGTDPSILPSIFKTGYANLASTDSGYFGKGLYSTWEAEYSKYYYQGALILNWVSSFSAYPVISGDMKKLTGKGNYQNYDMHFIPVTQYAENNLDLFTPENPDKTDDVFLPCSKLEDHKYTEIVVFEKSQCLPRYLITLQANLLRAPLFKISSVTSSVSSKSKGKLNLLETSKISPREDIEEDTGGLCIASSSISVVQSGGASFAKDCYSGKIIDLSASPSDSEANLSKALLFGFDTKASNVSFNSNATTQEQKISSSPVYTP